MLNKACDFLRTMIYHHQNPRGLDKWERVCRKSMLITCLYSFNRFEIISTKKRIIIRKKHTQSAQEPKAGPYPDPRPARHSAFSLLPSWLQLHSPETLSLCPLGPWPCRASTSWCPGKGRTGGRREGFAAPTSQTPAFGRCRRRARG